MQTTTKDPPGEPSGTCLATITCCLRGELLSSLRHFVRDLLGCLGDHETAWTAELLTSELLTNAIVHAPTSHAEMRIVHDRDLKSIWIGVADAGAAFTAPVHGNSPDAEGGRGIPLVAQLAHDWGVEPLDGGKNVWFRLPLDAA